MNKANKPRPRKEARELENKKKQVEQRKGTTIGALRERAAKRKAERKQKKREAAARAAEVFEARPERAELGDAPKTQWPVQSRDDADYAKLVAKWERKLDRECWQKSNGGWSKDGEPPVSVEDAIVRLNQERRASKDGFEERAAEYLTSRGWEPVAPAYTFDTYRIVSQYPRDGKVTEYETREQTVPSTWKRPNWQKSDGDCYRSLRRAYRLQIGLDAEAARRAEGPQG